MVFGFTAVVTGVAVPSSTLGIFEVEGKGDGGIGLTDDILDFDCSSSSILDEAFRGIDLVVLRLCIL